MAAHTAERGLLMLVCVDLIHVAADARWGEGTELSIEHIKPRCWAARILDPKRPYPDDELISVAGTTQFDALKNLLAAIRGASDA
jgi:hypothetical protein